jgi:hypothetical protein
MPEATSHAVTPPSLSFKKPSWTRDWPNLAIAGLTVILSLYTAWVGWQAMRGEEASLTTVALTPIKKTLVVPQLKLNQAHQRLGKEVEVDPAKIGKTDPFSN